MRGGEGCSARLVGHVQQLVQLCAGTQRIRMRELALGLGKVEPERAQLDAAGRERCAMRIDEFELAEACERVGAIGHRQRQPPEEQ
eukprot:scaffold187100_cov31-Tisochrysis_lutea.AAC.4